MDVWIFLSRINRKDHFDVASIQNYPIPLSMETSLFCRMKDIPFLFTPHYHGKGQTDLRSGMLRFYKPMGQRAFKWSSGIILNSVFEKDILSKDFPQFVDKMTIVSPGVKSKMLNDIKREPGTILFVGRIVDYKGIDYIMDAMKMLKGRGLECKLRIVGEGPNRSELSSKASGSGHIR